ncbi:hypothetical protein EA187_05705 [Lujinxingia sediminis]|uniref:EF-hand domain-containing protein n=1 Tax=Lujinxingia sediminis TaxID=2480984 RepID=A0ABY0CZC1_9DELT|nr:hypothetical protein [Lujinxingia sediminis]RVU48921.1 hypothetical protein EA187_05705 [Lujinxingia sediminis]
MTMTRNLLASTLLATLMALGTAGCGSDDSAERDMAELGAANFSRSRNDEGQIVERYDSTGDGVADVLKYFEESSDPEDPSLTRRRLVKLEIDANGDGNINVRRIFNEANTVRSEELDVDLDGKVDSILYFDGGKLTRKELIEAESGRVGTTRHYSDGTLIRVEKDENADERIDYWEFYEEGVLTRVGRDTDGDGQADTWQAR